MIVNQLTFFGDKDGKGTEIINPKINKKKSQQTDSKKVDESITDKEKKSETEENQQNNIVVDTKKQTESKTKIKDSIEGKEPIVLWLTIGFVVLVVVLGILKRYNIVRF